MPDSALIEAARRALRGQHQGTLIADGTPHRVRLVIDGVRGRIVANVPAVVLEAQELVLHVPEENPPVGPEVELLLLAEATDPDRDAACDRWMAAHGTPTSTRWISAGIESGRLSGGGGGGGGAGVFDGERLDLRNPWAAEEARAVKLLNGGGEALARALRARSGREIARPLVVGVDPDGLDVKTPGAVVPLRVEWEEARVDGALEAARRFLAGAGS